MSRILTVRLLLGKAEGICSPAGLCYCQEEKRLYITDMQHGRVVWCFPESPRVQEISRKCDEGCLQKPLAITRMNGQLYITDAEYNSLFVFKQSVWEKIRWRYGLQPELRLPGSITGDPFGNLYFTDFLNNKVCKIDAGGRLSVLPTVCKKPYGIYGSHTCLYITDAGNRRLIAYNYSEKKQRVLLRGSLYPIAVAADAEGDLYFSENRRIYLYHCRRNLVEILLDRDQWQRYGFEKLCHVGALALASHNTLYFSDTVKSGIYEIKIAKEVVSHA